MSMQEFPFYYEKRQRNTCFTVLMNIGVLCVMWWAAHHFLPNFAGDTESLLFWIDLVTPLVCCILVCVAAYLYAKNDKFFIRLSVNSLTVHDPLFGDYSWNVNLKDIVAITHTHGKQTQMSVIRVRLKGGGFHQLTTNYTYDRKRLYQQISQYAPHIEMPDHAYWFTQK